MKKLATLLLAAALMSCSAPTTPPDQDIHQRLEYLENTAALRRLVDTFSNLADVKDTHAQTFLFTENSVVETLRNGEVVSGLVGREQLGAAFGRFLSNFKTVYHINGQHTVTIDGNMASGTLYCLTVLITPDDLKTTIGVRYYDEYLKVNGQWLIAKRTSHFEWQDVTRLSL